MSSMDYTIGESAAAGYGTAYRQPTGTGLPDYEPGRFGTSPPPRPLTGVEWCDEAGCPREECAGCKAAA